MASFVSEKKMSVARKRVLIALDFDHTVIDNNSDTFIYQLAPDQKIPSDIKALYHKSSWTHYMNEVFKYLYQNGVLQQDFLHCLNKIQLTNGMKELLTSLPSDQTEIIIISDSNTIFINHILRNHGLRDKVAKIFTNFGEFAQNGCLKIKMYHIQHTCKLSTINLCKGDILTKYVGSRACEGVEFPRIAYVGDGFNDFCPCVRLKDCDGAFPRVGYNLVDTITQMERENNLKLKARVFPWKSGKDILKTLLPWYSDINEQHVSNPRLFDPGPIVL